MIYIKSQDEIKKLREGGKHLAEIMREVSEMVHPGVTTAFLNDKAEEMIADMGGIPSFKNYRGTFPAGLCTSVNEEIVHGIPSNRELLEGDIVSLDLGLIHRGLFTDHAITVPVGSIDTKTANLIEVTRTALDKGIEAVGPRAHLGDIGSAIHEYVKSQGLDVVRDLVGHGVGKAVHEEPQIPNYGKAGTGPELEAGMVLALEPMVVEGTYRVNCTDNNWTFVTRDGKLSAHFEHTVAVTHYGYEILTK